MNSLTSKVKIYSGIFCAAFFMAANAANAATVSMVPSETTLGLNDTLSIDIVISDLDVSEVVGAYDFGLSFDASVAEFTGYSFGGALGAGSFDASATEDAALGSIFVSEVSFESDVYLQANQPNSFTMATVDFLIVGLGSSIFSVDYQMISDEFGLQEIVVPAVGDVAVNAVPVPAAAWLFGSALLGLMGLRRKR